MTEELGEIKLKCGIYKEAYAMWVENDLEMPVYGCVQCVKPLTETEEGYFICEKCKTIAIWA